MLLYDKAGEEHYNLISALHKSVRNTDPDAALYWLARMLESGEDPLYIARRVVRMAVEDIGLADPRALAVTHGGDAGGRFRRPAGGKSRAGAGGRISVRSRQNQMRCIRHTAPCSKMWNARREPVPLHLRNAPTGLMKNIGYGKGYKYAHEIEEKVADMQCLPDNLRERQYYEPTNEGIERRIRERLEEIKRLKTGLPPREQEALARSKVRSKKES